MPTGAQLIVELLEREGVEVAFGLPGRAQPGAVGGAARVARSGSSASATSRPPRYAADGYARATGQLGVALTTTGPGAANTLGAVGEAWASRSPILVIATDIPAALRRPGVYRGVLHETTDQAAMFAPVVKATFVVARRRRHRRAGRRAVAAPGAAPTRPVYLQVPTDLLSAEVGGRRPAAPSSAAARTPTAAPTTLIDAAERPLIWAGSGARRRGGRGRGARRAPRGAGRHHLRRRRASCPRATRARSACRRTSSPSGGCGTRPTS